MYGELIPIVIMGASVGSFLGVLTTRLPEGLPIVMSRSSCRSCGKLIAMADMIPLLNHLWRRGRCRYCNDRYGYVPLFAELAGAAIAAWAWLARMHPGDALATTVFGWTLYALAAIDIRTMRLPNSLTAILMLEGMGWCALGRSTELADHLIGVIIGFASFSTVAWIYRQISGRDGLGLGDAKLLAGIGAWVAWQGVASVIFIAAAIGLLWGGGRLFFSHRDKLNERLPYGPFLAFAAWIAWLYGPISLGAWPQ